jgi:hypothetical protein
VPAPDPAAAREQAAVVVDTSSDHDDMLSRASSATVLQPRPLVRA